MNSSASSSSSTIKPSHLLPPTAAISKIHFEVLNPEQLNRVSVCEINQFLMNKKGMPQKNSPNDTRLGASEPHHICATCGEGLQNCPGHKGHIVLQHPCYMFNFIDDVTNMLNCLCPHCGKFLLSKQSVKFKVLRDMSVSGANMAKGRKKLVTTMARHVYCGIPPSSRKKNGETDEEEEPEDDEEDNDEKRPKKKGKKTKTNKEDSNFDIELEFEKLKNDPNAGCGGVLNQYIHDGVRVYYRPRNLEEGEPVPLPQVEVWTDVAGIGMRPTLQEHPLKKYVKNLKKKSKKAVSNEYVPFDARVARELLALMDQEVSDLFGIRCRPELLIFTLFPNLEPANRPVLCAIGGGKKRVEDDLSKKINAIVKCNANLEKAKDLVCKAVIARAKGAKTLKALLKSSQNFVPKVGVQRKKKKNKRDEEGVEEEDEEEDMDQTMEDDDQRDDEEEEAGAGEKTKGRKKSKASATVSGKENASTIEWDKAQLRFVNDSQNRLQVSSRPSDRDWMDNYIQAAESLRAAATLKAHEEDMFGSELNWMRFHETTAKIMELQDAVALWCNSGLSTRIGGTRGNPNEKAIADMYKGKNSRMRRELLGKRTDFGARAVISPFPWLEVDEIGVPVFVARVLTVKETVADFNIARLTKAVHNGPDVWPGARSIIRTLEDGTEETIDLSTVDRYSLVLQKGWIVQRHLSDGDPVLFNRQPSLHRGSKLGHRVRVTPHNTFGLNLAACGTYGADFDGDTMVFALMMLMQAVVEVAYLMNIANNIISPQNCKPVIAQVQDTVLGVHRLTGKDVLLSAQKFAMFLGNADHLPGNVHMPPYFPVQLRDSLSSSTIHKRYTGKQLITCLLPKGLYMSHLNGQFQVHSSFLWPLDSKNIQDGPFISWLSDKKEVIVDGIHLHGQLDGSVVGKTSNGLFHRLVLQFSNELAIRIMGSMQRVIASYLMDLGFSVSLADCISNEEDQIQNLIERAVLTIEDLEILKQDKKVHSPALIETKERVLRNLVQELRSMIGGMVQKKLNARDVTRFQSRLFMMVVSMSKGNIVNITQIMGCLGQTIYENDRPNDKFHGRVLPHFQRHCQQLQSRGFIASSFTRGLNGRETYMHALGGREGIVATSVSTPEAGYAERRMMNGLGGVQVKHDSTVRDAANNIIEMVYGGDGFDPVWLSQVKTQALSMSNQELMQWIGNRYEKEAKTKKPVKSSTKPKDHEFLWTEYEKVKTLRDEVRKYQLSFPGSKLESTILSPVNPQYHLWNRKMFENGVSTDDTRILSLPDNPGDWIEIVDRFVLGLYKHYGSYFNRLLEIELLLHFELVHANVFKRFGFSGPAAIRLLFALERDFVRAFISPGEAVGAIATQSLGEQLTQQTMDVFKMAGLGSMLGSQINSLQSYIDLSRIKESMTIYFNSFAHCFARQIDPLQALSQQFKQIVRGVSSSEEEKEIAKNSLEDFEFLSKSLVQRTLEEFCVHFEIIPTAKTWEEKRAGIDAAARLIPDISTLSFSHAIEFKFKMQALSNSGVTLDDVQEKITEYLSKNNLAHFAIQFVADGSVIRLFLSRESASYKDLLKKMQGQGALTPEKVLDVFSRFMLKKIVVLGIEGIREAKLSSRMETEINRNTGAVETKTEWCIITSGTNLVGVLALPWVDQVRTTTNDVNEISSVLGVYSAGQSLQRGIYQNMNQNGSSIEKRHISLLARVMWHRGKLVPLRREGISEIRDSGPLQKSAFEKTLSIIKEASVKKDVDTLNGIIESVMVGARATFGTGAVDVFLDPVNPSKEIEAKNALSLQKSMLPPVTTMDMAVLVHNTGHERMRNALTRSAAEKTEIVNPLRGTNLESLLEPEAPSVEIEPDQIPHERFQILRSNDPEFQRIIELRNAACKTAKK